MSTKASNNEPLMLLYTSLANILSLVSQVSLRISRRVSSTRTSSSTNSAIISGSGTGEAIGSLKALFILIGQQLELAQAFFTVSMLYVCILVVNTSSKRSTFSITERGFLSSPVWRLCLYTACSSAKYLTSRGCKTWVDFAGSYIICFFL